MAAARDLADGKLDSLHRVTPGYPLVLYLTRSTETPTRVLFFLSLLLHCASVGMVVLIARRAGLSQWYILLLLSCILLLPPYVEYSSYVLTENLAGFLLVAGLYCLLRGKSVAWSCVSGLVFGYLALVRPSFTLLSIAVALTLLAVGTWKRAVAVVLGASVIVLPFLLFNWLRFGYFGMAPLVADALAMKTARFVERLPSGPVRDYLLRERNRNLVEGESHTGACYLVNSDKRELSRLTGLSGVALENYLVKQQLRLIASAPLEFLAEAFAAFGQYWLPSAGKAANFGSRKLQFLWALVHFCIAGLFAVAFLALCGTSLTYRLQASSAFARWTYSLSAVLVFYTMAVSCVVADGLARYRVPTDAVIVLMTFLGIAIWNRERDHARKCLELLNMNPSPEQKREF
jgi:hypothetical protein